MALSALKLTNCHAINEAADELATILLRSILIIIDLSYNNLSTSDAVKIFNGIFQQKLQQLFYLVNFSSLKKIYISIIYDR